MQKTSNKQEIGLALDTKTRQVMRVHLGDRSRKSARTLWANLPEAYRRHVTFDTDLYVVYAGVIPAAQHRAMSNKARQSHHLERFNHTFRQRVSRLFRRALSGSKTLATPIGAIKMCMGHET